MIRLSDYDFELPDAQIAQAPLRDRGSSRLMVLQRQRDGVSHRAFTDIVELLQPGDLLVVNDARVVPARLIGRKIPTGGRAELLLVRPAGNTPSAAALRDRVDSLEWICLGQASKGLKPGTRVAFDSGLIAEVRASEGGGEYRVGFTASDPSANLSELLSLAGRLPLPPYISRDPTSEDVARYQTVYARSEGSVAAPTAGLHFTAEILAALEGRGVRRAHVTLDVGPGTFLPIRDDDVSQHKMHLERYEVPLATAEAIAQTRAAGRRVVAVGTTVVRTLEAATDPETGAIRPGPGDTALFITPGFAFRQVDALLTNFHLPRSTLLLLVAAFAGKDRILAAYDEAVAQGYRFFSYGDAMWIG